MTKFKVRCGQCIGCRLDHSLQWATRCMHESKQHVQNSFVTLTFSDSKMPLTRSVHKRPIQIFFKALRNHIAKTEPKTIRYLCCGEYSPQKKRPIGPFNPDHYMGEGQRPHYHAIIFNHDFPDKKLWSVRNGINIYTSDLLTNIWGRGHCTVGDLTYESAAYVARYSLKKINGPLEQKPHPVTGLLPYERICTVTGAIIEVEKERFQMSNGLGKDFATNYLSDIYPLDHVVINGYETRPPRYYDDIYDAENHDSLEAIKLRRIRNMEKHVADNTPARLREREKVKLAQLNQLKRDQL